MSSEYYKMDLHIHTPASKCYLGPKTDEEYFEILKTAHNQNLDIIAITDHNTISGYEHLFFLKNELLKKREILSDFKDSTIQINEALTEFDEKLSLFNDILIIPGVEITLNPGIHILVLSSPKNLTLLSELLDEIGYTEGKRGSDCDTEINVDIKNFLSNTKLNNFVVIAPHVDSNKGIFNSLTGQFRAEIMRSMSLNAFTCNALSQKENIITLFNKDPNYKRDFTPAFINCSDAHHVDDIGKKYSYIKLPSLSISEIKKVFENPIGNISDTNDQRLEKDILKLIEEEDPILISNTKLLNGIDFSKYVCATLNQGTNYIIIGVTPEPKITGVKSDLCDFEKLVKDSIELITSQYLQLRYFTTIETLGNGNNIVIIYLSSSVNCLWYTEEDEYVYIFDDNDNPIPANITQIESLVHQNTLCEISKLENKNTQTVSNLRTELLSLSNTVEKYELIQSIMLNGIPLLSMYQLSAHTPIKLDVEISETYFQDNGQGSGNLHYVIKNPLRLNNTILRYSCPTANVPEDILSALHLTEITSSSIVISQQGGSHITQNNQWIIGKDTDYLVLFEKEPTDISSHTVLAWLKSSLFTWYVYKRYNTTNIYLPEILREVIVPYSILTDISTELDVLVNEIISLEENFVNDLNSRKFCEECQKCSDSNCLIDQQVHEHNDLVETKTAQLDKLIFEAFCIDKETQLFIKEDLIAANIYNIIK